MIFNFYYGNAENTNVLNQIVNQLNELKMNIQELTAKVDNLQILLDNEQQEIALALAGLNQAIADLEALLLDGGTPEERQALADKLDAVASDLAATIPDLPEPV